MALPIACRHKVASTAHVPNLSAVCASMLVTDINHVPVGSVVEVQGDELTLRLTNGDVLRLSAEAIFGVGAVVQLICTAGRVRTYELPDSGLPI